MPVYWLLACILWYLLLIHGAQQKHLAHVIPTSFERERDIYPAVKEITGHAAQSGEHYRDTGFSDFLHRPDFS
jgi:hypothetical protein